MFRLFGRSFSPRKEAFLKATSDVHDDFSFDKVKELGVKTMTRSTTSSLVMRFSKYLREESDVDGLFFWWGWKTWIGEVGMRMSYVRGLKSVREAPGE